MLLSQTAVYGLRALATLAGLGPGEVLNAAQLSKRTAVPRDYLSKVMRKLVVARLVRGQRGHGGGFCLMRSPASIRVVDILVALDESMDGGCAFGYSACDESKPCVLHPIWNRLKSGLDQWARECTLAELGPEPVAPRAWPSRSRRR